MHKTTITTLPRRLLAACLLGLLTACGGGDPEPEPEMPNTMPVVCQKNPKACN